MVAMATAGAAAIASWLAATSCEFNAAVRASSTDGYFGMRRPGWILRSLGMPCAPEISRLRSSIWCGQLCGKGERTFARPHVTTKVRRANELRRAG
eukprot:scaffold272407_cov37-Tisochrysis_lutea.AAC.7